MEAASRSGADRDSGRSFGGARVDAALYGVSAVASLLVALVAAIPQYREWGRIAFPPYLAGALAASVLARRRAGPRPRAVLAGAIFLTAALLPLSLEAVWRSHTGPGFHAQSEILITEEAAKATLDGRDPYSATYLHGSLAARPLATKTHFPYLPGMLAFGLPRALDGRSPLADARAYFALATVLAAGLALGTRPPWPAGSRLRIAQVLLVLPTGALLMATGGDDLPVIGLILLSFVLLRDRRAAAAGIVAGLAAALKQTAWPVLPFLVLASRRRANVIAAALPVAAAVILPFAAWNPGAFVEDAIRFPLGLGSERSAAGTPTLGSMLTRAFPSARGAIVVVLVSALAAFGLWLLARPSSRTPAGAARNAGVLFVAAVVLAPAARIGYLAYPVNLLAWGWMLPSGLPGATVGSMETDPGGTTA